MGDRRRHLGWNPDSDSKSSLLPSPPGEQFECHFLPKALPQAVLATLSFPPPGPMDLAQVRVI